MAEALIQPDRCPPGDTASYLEPCAVVKYVSLKDDRDNRFYRPIFKVRRIGKTYRVWTVNRSQLKELPLDDDLQRHADCSCGRRRGDFLHGGRRRGKPR